MRIRIDPQKTEVKKRLTTERLARQSRNQTRYLTAKNAKVAKVKNNDSELGVLCALARVNPRVRVEVSGKFARAAQSINNIDTKVTNNGRATAVPFG
jgi:hypothetical protein